MNTWADESEEPLQPAPPEQRPKLNLKPRSQRNEPATTTTTTTTNAPPASSKSNPFGAAKPRELVLQSKGIDPAAVEKRAERKASVVHLTAEQDRQIEAVRARLAETESQLREANENELPEEEYRVEAERRRRELNELMEEFRRANSTAEGGTPAAEDKSGRREETRKFERPSERRRRLEMQRRGQGHGSRYREEYAEEGEDPYSSFGGKGSRYAARGGGEGGGGGRSYGEKRGGGKSDSYQGGGGGRSDSYQGGGRGGYHDRDGGYRHERSGRGSHTNRGSYTNRGGEAGSHDDYEGDKYAGERYNY